VDVELLRPLTEVLGTIVIAGSHDPVLGVLEDVLRAASPEYKLATRSIGSRAGLLALARGESHVAATCDSFGDAAAAGTLAGTAQEVVVHLVARELGLIVAPGNPLGLSTVADLMRADVRTPPEVKRSAVRFLSRATAQPGRRSTAAPAVDTASATPHDVAEEQELTPMAVAVAVESGLADTGLGIASAAAALGLGFVPIAREDYDLVLRADFAAHAMGRALLAAVRSSAFRDTVARLPGYDTSRTGLAKPLSDTTTGHASAAPATRIV
jgi:putative molybdopterin biosynthesis protein